jgi:hypothetical protein
MDGNEQEVLKRKDDTVAEYENLKDLIAKDDEIRQARADDDKRKQEDDDEKLRDKSSMADAARQIQRKWDWYQKIGRFQKKKGKGKKGKKGKKK